MHRGVARALRAAGLSLDEAAALTGVRAARLGRIVRGGHSPKVTELVLLALVTGSTVAELAGLPDVAGRVEFAHRPTVRGQREQLVWFAELDAYLHDHAIPQVAGDKAA